jgi:hypothetical protein
MKFFFYSRRGESEDQRELQPRATIKEYLPAFRKKAYLAKASDHGGFIERQLA